MPEWLSQLLRLDGLDAASPFVRFDFAVPMQAWHWPLLALGAFGAAVWCYRKSELPTAGRLALMTLRGLLLLLLVVLLLGPRLSRSSEVVESDTVAVLIDRSSSLTVADVPAAAVLSGAGPDARRVTRQQQLRTALEKAAPAFLAAEQSRKLIFLGFDSAATDLRIGPSGVPTLAEPTGLRTDLGSALESAAARAAGRPLAGILVLSDGRLSEPVARNTLRKLEAAQVGIFAVPLGSPDPAEDIAVRAAESPGVAFVGDTVPIRVEVTRAGGTTATASKAVQVELVDPVSGTVLDTRRVEFPNAAAGNGAAAGGAANPDVAATTLVGIAAEKGKRAWVVRARTATADLVAENDSRSVDLDFTDRPLRILHIDGYPRWEYRYLKNLLAREKSVEFASLLLSPGRRYIQEGTTEIDGAPTTREEWDRYDVIILGDVKPDVFSGEQLDMLRARVTDGGAGLLLIAGTSAVPDSWRATRLGDLIPFNAGTGRSTPMWDQDVTMRPTPLAERLSVLRLADPVPGQSDAAAAGPSDTSANIGNFGAFWNPAISDPASGWSRLRWAQRIERNLLKPAAEVLAEAAPAVNTEVATSALVTTMRFGSGRVIYVATDEIWRYRYGRGEDLTERFWLQLIRLLGREAAAKAGRPAVLEAAPARATVGQPVTLTLTLIDQSLVDAAPGRVAVGMSLKPTTGGAGAQGAQGGTSPTAAAEQLAVVELTADAQAGVAGGTPGRRTYTGVWMPQVAGTITAAVNDPGVTARGAITAEVLVTSPDDELRRPEADHGTLADLARATGGSVIRPQDLGGWQDLLPKREIRQVSVAEVRTLWDTPLALMLVLTLLALEWSLRRLMRMV
jgi:hypothetical protein